LGWQSATRKPVFTGIIQGLRGSMPSKRDITQIGGGKSSLDAVVAHVAALEGRIVRPDQFPDLGTFYRSDQSASQRLVCPLCT
jgi:hypothetical protein